jgi:hypothetical protein
LQATSLRSFSLQKFLNIIDAAAVFMSEDRQVLAGEAILSEAATAGRTDDRSSEFERSREITLEGLVRGHSRLVYRIAYAVLRSHHDAEDATQETFLRVLRHRSKLAAVEDPKTWLARIAWRAAVDRSKKRAAGNGRSPWTTIPKGWRWKSLLRTYPRIRP